jgi:hypothetical protein
MGKAPRPVLMFGGLLLWWLLSSSSALSLASADLFCTSYIERFELTLEASR